MRVSDTSMYKQFLSNMNSNRVSLERALGQLASNKRVRVASDDPLGARRSLDLRGQLVRSEGYRRSGDAAQFDLATMDRVLGEAVNLMIDVRAKGMSGASGIFEQAQDVLATEIEQIREQMLALANTEQNGRFLFSGTSTLTQAFDPAGVYQGNGNEVQAAIDPNLKVGVTVSGQRAFQGKSDIFTTLDDLVTAFRADDTDAIEALLPDLTAALDQLNVVRTEIGTREALIDRTQRRLEDEQFQLQRRISQIEDIGLPEVSVALASANNALEALSTAGARSLGRSLFDFLG